MPNPSTGAVGQRFEVGATAANHFSWINTRLSLERTLMSWVRTGVSLIGFGFTIVQINDRFHNMSGFAPAVFPDAARYLGLALVLGGVIALLVSIQEYLWSLRYLWSERFATIAGARREGMRTPLFVIAIGLAIVGSLAFFALLLRLA